VSPPRDLRAAKVVLAELDPPARPDSASAVVQVLLSDGREFSLLAATPLWFRRSLDDLGLDFYYGPAVLFLERVELSAAKTAVNEMLRGGDQWLCRYDTPRMTLPKVLSQFKERHP